MKFFALFFIITSLAQKPTWAKGKQIDLKKRCQQTQARAILPVLESAIKFKTDFTELNAALKKIDTNKFCDCVYNKLESVFGGEKLQRSAQYNYQISIPTLQLIEENQQKEKIYFSCFGQQISRSDLAPATKEEMKQHLYPSSPSNLAQQKTQTMAILKNLKTAISMYQIDHQQPPKTLNDLTQSSRKYIEPKQMKDAWGNNILYRLLRNNTFKLISPGIDHKDGTPDDVELEE